MQSASPEFSKPWHPRFSRRRLLKLMGASLALAGVSGCTRRQPLEEIVPYVDPPENVTPGRPLFYATAFPCRGFARGIIVEQHEGRPTKIEGNPRHPSSLGGSDAFMQASILELYDPDRSSSIVHHGVETSWESFLNAFRAITAKRGKSTRISILTGTVTSPSFIDAIQLLQSAFPETRCYYHDPLPRDAIYHGSRLAFGRPATPVYDFLHSDRIVSVDADFLSDDPGGVRYARDFSYRRRIPFHHPGLAVSRLTEDFAPSPVTPDSMSRLYVAESALTITGAMADHRVALPAALLPRLVGGIAIPQEAVSRGLREVDARWLSAASEDLKSFAGRSLLVVGANQPPMVHALCYLLNHQLGNVGRTVRFIDPPHALASDDDNIASLDRSLKNHDTDVLIVIDCNASYNSISDLSLGSHVRNIIDSTDALTVHFGLYRDETAACCQWHLPASHYLESWGDARGHDGTASIVQPVIAPLHTTRSSLEFLWALASTAVANIPTAGRQIVRDFWLKRWRESGVANPDQQWLAALQHGVIADSASPSIEVAPVLSVQDALVQLPKPDVPSIYALEITIRPDSSVSDGHFSNNAWLQELPRPFTMITWDNAAIISPATAVALKLATPDDPASATGKLISIQTDAASVVIPAFVQPGQPDLSIALHLGYGRKAAGGVGNAIGVNVYPLRTSEHLWIIAGAKVDAYNGFHHFARTQDTQILHGRNVSRDRSIHFDQEQSSRYSGVQLPHSVHLSLYTPYVYDGYKWGMVIDQSACIGCRACVVACQAENNIPVVGKEQVRRGREMHWIRIDTYFGDLHCTSINELHESSHIHFQPMLCQHCENAPCEVVCPVGATTHSDEGINEMTYNRCVGTRYCSNNCPYKVRRFNFFQYADRSSDTLAMQRNPEVTVRSRGVMEKCTFCIQRINRERILAKELWVQNDSAGKSTTFRRSTNGSSMKLPPLNVTPACAEACPTEAIIFGDLNDADTLVSRLTTQAPWNSLAYGVLTELNTRPRITYLERLRNPHPSLENAS